MPETLVAKQNKWDENGKERSGPTWVYFWVKYERIVRCVAGDETAGEGADHGGPWQKQKEISKLILPLGTAL